MAHSDLPAYIPSYIARGCIRWPFYPGDPGTQLVFTEDRQGGEGCMSKGNGSPHKLTDSEMRDVCKCNIPTVLESALQQRIRPTGNAEEQEKMAEPYINHAQRRLCQSKQKRVNKPHGTLLAGNLGPLIASHESRRQGHSLMQEAE